MIFFSSVDATMLPSTNKTQNYYKPPVMAIQNFCSSDLSVYSLDGMFTENCLHQFFRKNLLSDVGFEPMPATVV